MYGGKGTFGQTLCKFRPGLDAKRVRRHGRYGTFIECGNYPRCKFTMHGQAAKAACTAQA